MALKKLSIYRQCMGQNEKYLQNPADELSEKEQIIEATLFSKQLKLIN